MKNIPNDPSFLSIYIITIIALAVSSVSVSASAADNALIEYKDPIGLSIQFDNTTGEWIRIRASGIATCVICDARDMEVSSRKAELKAKAAIVKFMEEKISTSEVIDEAVKTITENNGQTENINRKTIETQLISIHNSATAIIKGVLVIEQKPNIAQKNYEVTVGVSRKTIGVANSVGRAFKMDARDNLSNGSSPYTNVDGQMRRSKSYDTF